MPAIRSRGTAANAVFFTNQADPPQAAASPVTFTARPASAGEFGHTLVHEQDIERRADSLKDTLERYGESGCGTSSHGNLPSRLEARWRSQLSLRRRWFESQVRTRHVSAPQAEINRRAGLMLISESEASAEGEHDCAHHASLADARAQKGGCSHSHHHNERGLLMVDLDEAAHGVYASVKQTLPLFNGEGVGKIKQEFAEQTALLANDPVGWMAHDVPSSGVADFSAAMGTSMLVAPLAVIAVKAGISETRDAWRIRSELSNRASSLVAKLDMLDKLVPQGPGGQTITLAEAAHKVAVQLSADTGFAARINRLRLGIGLASAASGATIFLKTAIDIGLKVALVASAKKLNVVQFLAEHGVATAAVTAVGVAGTLVLGPLAGIFATALGAFFARKSALRHRAFREDRARVEGFLRTVAEQQHAAGQPRGVLHAYTQFIDRKMPQRARFYRSFKRWNLGFLGGSSLYAASAITKAAIGIAALAGAGALISNPIGWGILLGVGVVGAVIMGVASWQFLFGHPKNERYERYCRDDHPELDRHFLAGLDILPPPEGKGPWAGVELRAQLFEQLEKHADALARLKKRIASKINKKPTSTAADILPNLAARFHALAAGAGVFLRSASVRRARVRSSEIWSRRARQLTESDVAAWLDSSDSTTAWWRFSWRYLKAQREYLEHKLAYRLSVYEQHAVRSPQPNHLDAKTQAALAGLLADSDAAAELDQVALERIRQCLSIKPSTERANRLLLGVLSGVKAAALDSLDASAVRRELATALLRDLPRRLRDTKGMLLETEMQAARLRTGSETELRRTATRVGRD